ncbi:MAG: O-antigen ligase family protein [Anaerolineae bacterium]
MEALRVNIYGVHLPPTVVVVSLCLLAGATVGALIAFLTAPLALALLFALAGGLAMLRNIQVGFWALVGTICLLPFAALPVDIGFAPTFLDLVLIVLFGVWLVRVMSRENEEFVASPLALPVLIFIGIAVVSFVAGLGHAGLTPNVLRHFVEIIIGISIFFVVINCVQERSHLEGLVRAIILAGFAEALIGVILYFMPQGMAVRLLSTLRIVRYPAGWGVLRFIEDNPQLPMRAIATSIDPNILGGLLILIAALTAPQLFTSRPLIRKVFVAPMLAVMGLCMVLTFSRGSFAGLGVALILLGILRYRRLVLVLAVLGALFFLLPQTQGYVERLWEGIRGTDLATRMRLGEYKDALILISRYPLIGVGFAGTPDIDVYIGVSSVYLLIAEQMGLIGLLAFLIAIAVFFAYTRRGGGGDEGLEAISLGIKVALAGALVAGILDHYLFNLNFPHAVTIFWLYIGLGVAVTRLATLRNSNAAPASRP